MKKIKVLVRDRNTLVLEESATKGDYISLSDISELDYMGIENIINLGKDEIYNKKLEEYKKVLKLENEQVINELRNKINLLKKDNEFLVKERENEIEIK